MFETAAASRADRGGELDRASGECDDRIAAEAAPSSGETKTEPTDESAAAAAGRCGARGFREDFMSAHSGRLHHALKHIREQWDITQEAWDDPVSRDFERIHLDAARTTDQRRDHRHGEGSEVLGKIKAQCKED